MKDVKDMTAEELAHNFVVDARHTTKEWEELEAELFARLRGYDAAKVNIESRLLALKSKMQLDTIETAEWVVLTQLSSALQSAREVKSRDPGPELARAVAVDAALKADRDAMEGATGKEDDEDATTEEWIDNAFEILEKYHALRAVAERMDMAGSQALFLLQDIQRDEKADGRTLTGRFDITVSNLRAALAEWEKVNTKGQGS
jgi:hypothetical protein